MVSFFLSTQKIERDPLACCQNCPKKGTPTLHNMSNRHSFYKSSRESVLEEKIGRNNWTRAKEKKNISGDVIQLNTSHDHNRTQ